MHIYSFEKLEAWQNSRKLNLKVYHLTDAFPSKELFTLTSQIRRCSISVSSNIAEGSGRITAKDQSHFTAISFGSLMELLNQLILSQDLGYITEAELQDVRETIDQTARTISGLRKVQLERG